MAKVLNIFDVSGLLYAGQCVKSFQGKADTLSEAKTAEGIPIGGVRYALKTIFSRFLAGEFVLLVFDSKTDKNFLFEDYKGNRTANPAVYVQQNILYDVVSALGLPILKKDLYEADDLIAAAVTRYYKVFEDVVIYTGDADVYANIIASNIRVVGTASIYPSVTCSNYSYVVRKDLLIQYNTILPYFAIFGKPSNNVPSIGAKDLCNKAYQAYLHYISDNHYDLGLCSTTGVFAAWLLAEYENENSVLSKELVEELVSRIDYVFPKPYEEEINLKFLRKDEIDKEKLEFYLKALNLDTILLDFGMICAATGNKTPEMLNYIRSYQNAYMSGVLAVDADMTPDMSFFEGEETTFFTDAGDF